MESLLVYYLVIWEPLGYILNFLGVGIEGDVSLFTFAFLTSQGFFNFWPMLMSAFLGAILSDIFFYFLGRKINSMPRAVVIWSGKISSPFDHQLRTRTARTLLISKITYAVHKPILVRIGMIGVPFKKFLWMDIPSSIVWLILIGGLGYFSGVSFYLVKRYLHYAEIGILLGLVFLYILGKVVTKYSIRELKK